MDVYALLNMLNILLNPPSAGEILDGNEAAKERYKHFVDTLTMVLKPIVSDLGPIDLPYNDGRLNVVDGKLVIERESETMPLSSYIDEYVDSGKGDIRRAAANLVSIVEMNAKKKP